MALPDPVTVTLSRLEYRELCNLVQLIAVAGVELYLRGPQPSVPILKSVFDKLTRAGLPDVVGGGHEHDNC